MNIVGLTALRKPMLEVCCNKSNLREKPLFWLKIQLQSIRAGKPRNKALAGTAGCMKQRVMNVC